MKLKFSLTSLSHPSEDMPLECDLGTNDCSLKTTIVQPKVRTDIR